MLMWGLTLGLLAVSGITLLSAFMTTRSMRQTLDHRIGLVSKALLEGPMGSALSRPLAWTGKLGKFLFNLFCLGLTRRWGITTQSTTLILTGLIAAVVMWLFTRTIMGLSYGLVLPLVSVAFILVPRFFLLHEQAEAEREFTNMFPDCVDMIVRMLRAGLPITGAIRSISSEAVPPVNTVFSMLVEQEAIGVPLDEALDSIGKRIGLPDFRFFAVAVSLQHATGGNLASTLEILTDIMRKRRSVRMKMQAATAEVRLSSYVLGAMPFMVFLTLLVVNPSYLTPLIKDTRGNMIVGLALTNLFIAFITMRHMVRSITTIGT